MKLTKSMLFSPPESKESRKISTQVLKHLGEQEVKTLLAISFPSRPTRLSHSTLSSFGLTSSGIHSYLHPKHVKVVRSVMKQWIDSASQSSLLHVPSTHNSAWPTGVHNVFAEIKEN